MAYVPWHAGGQRHRLIVSDVTTLNPPLSENLGDAEHLEQTRLPIQELLNCFPQQRHFRNVGLSCLFMVVCC
jgi:hypothetical protein